MKKKNLKFNIIFPILINCIAAICLIVGLIIVFNFKTSNVIEREDFNTYMDSINCPVTEIKEEDNIKYETDNTCSYYVSYAIYNEEIIDEDVYNIFKEIEDNTSKVTKRITITFPNYKELSTKSKKYKKVVITNNTILFTKGDSKYSDEINNLYYHFGYRHTKQIKSIILLCLSIFIILVLFIVSMWKTLKKTRNKGYLALIPFYNIWCLSKDIMGSYLYFFLLFIPPLGEIVFHIMFYYKMAKRFNYTENGILLIVLPSIYWPKLAFSDNEYIPLQSENKNSKENTKTSIIKSKLFLRLLLITYTLWNIFQILALIDQGKVNVDDLIVNVAILIICFLVSFIITSIVNLFREKI